MSGTELETFCEKINGGASIGSTVLFQFINLAKAMVEQRVGSAARDRHEQERGNRQHVADRYAAAVG